MWKRAASYPPAATPRVSQPGHSTVAWLSPDWPSRYAAAGAPVAWLTEVGIWVSVDLLTARSVCSGSRMTPEPVASSLMRRVREPDASEVRSKMSAWPRSRVAVVPAGAVRMTAQVVASASDKAVASSVEASVASAAVAAASLATASAVSAVASSAACAAPGTRKEVAARAMAAKARAAARPGFRYFVGFMRGSSRCFAREYE